MDMKELRNSKLFSAWGVFWILLVLGPFGLPVLWLSPRFSTTLKLIITLLLIVITYLLTKYTAVLFGTMTEHIRELQSIKT